MATMDAERIFVDTNVLLAATDEDRATHTDAVAFLESGWVGEARLFVSGQIFREYLVVATRPVKANGLGMELEAALANLKQFRQVTLVLPEDAETALRLCDLVRRHQIRGKGIHDANVVASMLRHGLQKLKTYNPRDFEPFEAIELIA